MASTGIGDQAHATFDRGQPHVGTSADTQLSRTSPEDLTDLVIGVAVVDHHVLEPVPEIIRPAGGAEGIAAAGRYQKQRGEHAGGGSEDSGTDLGRHGVG
jgi:hypothetical protein